MNTDVVVGLIGAAVLLLAALLGAPRLVRDPLTAIHKQIEIYQGLPHEPPAKQTMLDRIEQQVAGPDIESTARRNPIGIALGSLFLISALVTTWLVVTAGGWWWLVSPLVLTLRLVGVVGFAQALGKIPRTTSGGALKNQRDAATRKR